MTHPLVTQLRFTRSEFVRGLRGVSEEDGIRRVGRMNSISWIVGHVASQELYLWVEQAQGEHPFPGLHERVGWGSAPNTPPLGEMWATWRTVTQAADRYLDTVTAELLPTYAKWDADGDTGRETVGTRMLRNIYHYWFHLGEAHAIRQVLGHSAIPEFVGNMAEVRY